MMKHTPGPWTITDQEWNREKGSALNGNTPVVRMSGPCDAVIVSLGADKSEQMANARLIAASPQLLRILKQIVSDVDDVNYEQTISALALHDARAAIADATGE